MSLNLILTVNFNLIKIKPNQQIYKNSPISPQPDQSG